MSLPQLIDPQVQLTLSPEDGKLGLIPQEITEFDAVQKSLTVLPRKDPLAIA